MDPKNNDGTTNPSTRIAIIGLGGCFPDAQTVAAYWDNICRNHVAISEVPPERWDPQLYFSTDRAAPEKTYSRIGGFVRQMRFDARRFRIPPRSLAAIDDVQKMALTAVADALEDAGLEVFPGGGDGRPFDRDRTAVILGNAMGGEAEDRTSLRVWFAEVQALVSASAAACELPADQQEALLSGLERRYKERLPTITEDSMPGELSNCITGRIANAFDLRGPNFTTDAACAASMAALLTATRGLMNREYDLALAGGADRSMDPPTYVKFSKIGALSGEASAPFDARANGFVMGEGVGVMVLKRLEDALRDGNKVYAVIRGVGAASDGKGKGITAPNPRGQRMAIERAYADAGISVASVGLFEAHGTSTTVGDAAELQVLTDLLRNAGASKEHPVAIGSVKSMIGHLKSAAGAAAVIKAALALHHKILPPSANFRTPPVGSPLGDGYLAVNTQTRPWPAGSEPRRAGVSAFGFGGTNFHVVLEEFSDGMVSTKNTSSSSHRDAATPQESAVAAAGNSEPSDLATEIVALFADKTGYAISDLAPTYQLEADLGIDTVKQAEILGILRQRYGLPQDETFRLSDTPTLASVVSYVHRMTRTRGERPLQSVQPSTSNSMTAPRVPSQDAVAGGGGAAAASKTQNSGGHNASNGGANGGKSDKPEVLLFGGSTAAQAVETAQRVLAAAAGLPAAIAGRNAALEATGRLAFFATHIDEARRKAEDAGKRRAKVLAAQGIYLAEGEPLARSGKIAFLFPGQGSQYLGMMRDLALAYPVVARTFAEADDVLVPLVHCRLTDIVWADVNDETADLRLRETQNCQPAMLTADVAMMRLLQDHGVQPAMVAGHSLGEYAAAVAAGVLTFADALYAVSARGREMAGVKVADNGKMAMVAADVSKVQPVLDNLPGYIIAANKNCHTQTVIAGESAVVDEAVSKFAELGIEARQIPVSHAFHSRIVAPAEQPLARVLRGLTIHAPHTPISSNVDASYYPTQREDIIAVMARQLASPVEFIAQVERLYDDGARIFVEVGPRRAITGFVRNILGQREHRALATNHPKKPGVEVFAELLAALASDGVPVRFDGGATVALQSGSSSAVSGDRVATVAPTKQQADSPKPDAVVVSGMALALPSHDPVADDGVMAILQGTNFIEPVPAADRRAMLDRNVVRLDKAGGAFTALRDMADVIQLAARFGELDLTERYGIDASWVEALDSTGRLALAVGIDALRDAGLPLVRRYRETSTGKRLPDRWALPSAISARTGVILASAFPGVDALLEEAARYAAASGARRSAEELEHFIDSVVATLRDPSEAAALRQQFAARATTLKSEAALYQFNRKWLFRVLSLGHAQIAQLILAQGPNTQINAACASGTQAIGIAKDWIVSGRADRVLVVTADDVTHNAALPWFGAGFLATGAATVEADIRRAAVPFGAQRNGMILGAGASAFVIERDAELARRGMAPLAEVAFATFGNSAFHGTRLDSAFIRNFVGDAVGSVEKLSGLPRQQLAKRLVFMSHETYTPARGGSSAAEVDALRHAFGADVSEVLITNTKGYTGHSMGATVEDAVLIKGLQHQQMPAVANLSDVDPAFRDLNFAHGGQVDAEWGMRFAAGFGSQVALAVYKRRATQEARLLAPENYEQWLMEVTGRADAGLEVDRRTLRVAEAGGRKPWQLGVPSMQRALADVATATTAQAPQPSVTPVAATERSGQVNRAALLRELTDLFAEQTGYAVTDLVAEHGLEADLGIDTVKQAEIFGLIRQRYGFAPQEGFKLSEVQTLAQIVDYVAERLRTAPHTEPAPVVAAPRSQPQQEALPARSHQSAVAPASAVGDQGGDSRAQVLAELTDLFAEHTGYAPADLAPSHALEADLGIDTVKQAEIFGLVRKRYGLAPDQQFRLADVPTLDAVVDYVCAQRADNRASVHATTHGSPSPSWADEAISAAQSNPPATQAAPPASISAAAKPSVSERAVESAALPADGEVASVATTRLSSAKLSTKELLAEITALFAEHTGYGLEDLEPTHHLEADLGIDTVKQAEIFGKIRQRYGLAADASFRLTDVQTLEAIAQYVADRQFASPSKPHSPNSERPSAASLNAARTQLSHHSKDGVTSTSQHEPDVAGTDVHASNTKGGGQTPALQDALSEPVEASDDSAFAAAAGHLMAPSKSASSSTSTSAAAVVVQLVDIFAAQTGYERADLHPHHGLEADLGIDTVKQAEIFGVVRQHFGLPRDEHFRLADYQSIAAIADYVVTTLNRASVAPMSQTVTEPLDAVGGTGNANVEEGVDPAIAAHFTARQVGLVPVVTPPGGYDAVGKQIVVVGGDAAAQSAFRGVLVSQQAQVHCLSWETICGPAGEGRLGDLGGKPADGMVWILEPCDRDPSTLQRRVVALLSAGRTFARGRAGKMGNAGILAVSRDGGAFGFHHARGDALLLAAAAGAIKSLAKEWPEARCVAVDTGTLGSWAEVAVKAVEAWGISGPCEMSWHHGAWWMPRRRDAVTIAAKPLAPHSIVLATGGARGVTFGLLEALAQRGPLRCIILSRTEGVAPERSPLTGRDEAEQKELARAAVGAVGERATPAAIRRWIERERVRLEIHANLERLRALGSEVELLACDVADQSALAQALAHVRWRYGSVDVLLHGAGVEESRYLMDKDDAALQRVVAPKAIAALRLWETVRPRRMVTMGSVAGRFGNAAQADYAAANEMMAAMARGEPGGLLNLDWTAWDDVGMATRGSVRQVLGGLGVEMLPAALGYRIGAQLIASEVNGDVVVAGGLGHFDTSEAIPLLPAPPLPPLFSAVERRHDVLVLSRRYDVRKDIGLDHHRIDGIAVLPGVLGVEMMMQAAAYYFGAPVTSLRQVRFHTPVKLFRDEALDVAVEVQRQGIDATLTLVSQFVGPGGRKVRREHFRAVASSEVSTAPLAPPDVLEIPGEATISREDVYRRYFHGPAFQVLERVLRLGENGADAQPLAQAPLWLAGIKPSEMISAPMWREAGFQIAGLWEMAELGRMALPAGIDELWRVRPAQGQVFVEARRRSAEENGSTFDIWVRDEAGNICDVMRGYHTVTLRDLTADERFEPARRQQPAPTSLVVPISEVEGLLQQDADAALERYLSPAERTRFASLVVQKRRLEWLGARIAAKRLIRSACFSREGAIVPYHAITIHRDALGAPEVEIVGDSGPVPRISMSHSDGVAAAFLSPSPDIRPGIDVERIEKRDPSFAETYFTAAERKSAAADGNPEQVLTEIWAVKEAVLKALGLGARVDFREVAAEPRGGKWLVTLSGDAQKRAQELGTGSPEVQVEAAGARVIARVLLPVGEGLPTHDSSLVQARV